MKRIWRVDMEGLKFRGPINHKLVVKKKECVWLMCGSMKMAILI